MQASSEINLPDKSGWLYQMDPRAKMLVGITVSLSVVILSNLEGLLLLFVVTFLYALGMRRLAVLLKGYLFLLFVFLVAAATVYLLKGIIPKLLDSLKFAALLTPFLRLAIVINVVLPMAFTCRIQEIMDALRTLRLPFWIYLPAVVMIRFIPTFMEDMKHVADAVKLRGYELTVLNVLRHPGMTLRILFVPLLFRSLKTSEDLGISAEMKGLGGVGKTTSFRRLTWKKSDTLIYLLFVVAIALGFLCQHLWGVDALGGMHK